MKSGSPRDDTLEYTDQTLTQARLKRDYLRGDRYGTLWVILLALFVTGVGLLLLLVLL
jgi:hypothetical protein